MDALTSHAVAFVLVISRLSGLFVFGPYLSGLAVPMRIKAMLVLTTAAAVYPVVPLPLPVAPGLERLDVLKLLPLIAGELLIGMVVGFLASLPLMALESAGVIIGQQMGFGLAKVYNPDINIEADIIGQMLFYLGAGAFLAMGGLEGMFLAIVRTFEAVPAGAMDASLTPLDLMVRTLTAGLELSMRVAAPVIGIISLVMIVLGAVGKTMPQINIMSVGFSFKIMAGLGVLAFSVTAISGAAGDDIALVMRDVLRWAESLGDLVRRANDSAAGVGG